MEQAYRQATAAELKRLWEKNVARNPDDPRWVRWAREYIYYNENEMGVTFAAVLDGEPVGEATLLLSPECGAIEGRTELADGRYVGNVNALRIEKLWEGQGHISRLVRVLERYAQETGLRALTIGVDAVEARNLAIYLHWGYTRLVHWEVEDDELVLYYRKELTDPPN